MEPILSVKNLTKSFAGKVVVNDISFSVKKGEIMGLLGPNGAGKTTAIRIIMGILAGDSGRINFLFNGKSTKMDKNKIGYLPEERGLYDDAKVLDILIYLAGLKGIPQDKARDEGLEWLKKVDLGDYAQQKLEKLSKGMQQKVQFIASILHKPALVMLDEPFSGLDPLNQDFIKETIRELRNEGMTVLLSAHQMNLVEEICDSIFMINKGKQVLSGKLDEIKEGYKEHKVHIRFPEGEDSSFLNEMSGVKIENQDKRRILLRYSGSTTISAFLNAVSSKLSVEEITVEKPPLHDIFIQTVKERGETIEESEII